MRQTSFRRPAAARAARVRSRFADAPGDRRAGGALRAGGDRHRRRGGARRILPAVRRRNSGPPGTIIRKAEMPFAPGYVTAYRVLYRSRGLNDEPIAVSGVVIAPTGAPPPGGRPVVAWAHPTTGVATRCAPSRAMLLFQQIQGLRELIGAGYVVAATDYPGLGGPGVHPYLVGDSEARAVIDNVRAARAISELGASNAFAVWGHSQGGQAALFTGLIAGPTRPSLSWSASPPRRRRPNSRRLMSADLGTAGGRNLTAMTLWSWQRVFDAPMAKVVEPDAIPAVNRLAEACIEFDLRHSRPPQADEAVGAGIPVGRQPDRRRTLARARRRQHARPAAARDSAVPRPGRRRPAGRAGGDARLFRPLVPRRGEGAVFRNAARGSRDGGARRRAYGGGVDRQPLR